MMYARIAVVGPITVAAVLSIARADVLNVPGQYPTIQAAIDAAQDGDEVVVGSGTYHELIDFLGKMIVLHSSDGPNATTIDALGLGGSAVTCIGCSGSLQGLTITGGTGTFDPFFNQQVGGGLYIEGGSLQVTDLVLTQNTATFGSGAFSRAAPAIFSGCVFIGNQGMSLFGQPGVNVVDCQFINNSGGAIGTTIGGTVTGCLFDGNSSAFYVFGLASGYVANCRFVNNAAGAAGDQGILDVSPYWDAPPGDPQIVDCVFANNQTGLRGAAVRITNSPSHDVSPLIDGCVFAHNTAYLFGGGIFFWEDPSSNVTATVTNSEFCENEPNDISGGDWVDGGGNEFLEDCCPADVNGDDVVGVGDFLLVLAQWGPGPPECLADIDGNGVVGILDFLAVLAGWGPCF